MKRLLKILAWVLLALVLLVIAAVIAVLLLVDPNDYRDEIAALAKKQTGRELAIEGDIGLSVFPWLGVKLGETRLGNAPGFGPEPFARVQQAQVRVKLLPLLRREIQVDTLSLEGLRLHLARNAQGVSNWDDLLKRAEAEAEQPAPTPGEPQARDLGALAVGGVRISDAQVVWDDRMAGQRVEAKNLALETGELDLRSPFPLHFEADVASNAPEVSGHIVLDSEVLADLAAERYTLNGLALDLRLAGPLVPGGTLAAQLAADAHADLKNQTAELSGLNLDAFGLRLTGRAEASGILEAPEGKAELNGAVRDARQFAAALKNLAGVELDAGAVKDGRLALQAEASLPKGTARLARFDLAVLGATVGLNLDASGLPTATVAKGKLTAEVKDGAALRGFLPPDLDAAGLTGARLSSSFQFDQAKQTARLPDLQLAGLGLDLRGEMNATGLLGEKPQAAGKLTLGEFVPRAVLGKLGVDLPEMADPNTLTKAALATGFEASTEHVALADVNLRFDDTTAKGRFSLRDFARPVIRYDLTMDQLDADRYLPPPSEEGTTAPPASAAATAPLQLPLDLLRSLDVDGTLRVGKLKAANMRTSEVRATLRANGGQLRLNPVGAKLYGGSYAGNIGLDVRRDVPALSMDEKLTGVQVGPLLKDFMGKDYVTGRAQLAAQLTARGADPMAIRKTLNGNASFRFEEGAVNGINIAQLIREGLAKAQGRPAPKEETRSTDFSEMKGTVTVKDGLVSNNDLSAKSPLLRVNGKGTAHLVTEKLDYRIDAAIVGTLEGAGGAEMRDLKGLTVPIHIGGTFTKPKFDVPIGKLLEERARSALEAEKKKKEQELQQRLEQEKKRLQKDLEKSLKDMLKLK
ncbi:MAG: AsmA family protein [Thiohalomonadaceae bacterium]